MRSGNTRRIERDQIEQRTIMFNVQYPTFSRFSSIPTNHPEFSEKNGTT